jgi:hypothetical protein
MKRAVLAASAAGVVASAAHAGFVGFAGFGRIASNGNRVIDVFVVVSNAGDRLLNVYDANVRNNLGSTGNSFFIQQAGTATRGWKPDAASSTRGNITDSFCTIGVQDGIAYEGQYYASGSTGADGGFATGWTTLGNTMPVGAGWFLSPPTLPDNQAESLAGVAGTRVNQNAAAAAGTYGIWCAHLVMSGADTNAQGALASCLWTLSAAIKDAQTQQISAGTATDFNLIPVPGVLAFALVGGVARRRPRE